MTLSYTKTFLEQINSIRLFSLKKFVNSDTENNRVQN